MVVLLAVCAFAAATEEETLKTDEQFLLSHYGYPYRSYAYGAYPYGAASPFAFGSTYKSAYPYVGAYPYAAAAYPYGYNRFGK